MARVPLSHCDAVVSGVCPFLCTVRCNVGVQTCCFSSVSFPPRPLLPVRHYTKDCGLCCKWLRQWLQNAGRLFGGLTGQLALLQRVSYCILVERVSPFSLREGVCLFNLLFLGRLASTTLTNSWPHPLKKVEVARRLQCYIQTKCEPLSELKIF